MTKKAKKAKRDEWLCGYAAAMSAVVRHGDRSLAKVILISDGLTVESFRKAGAEDYDMQELARIETRAR